MKVLYAIQITFSISIPAVITAYLLQYRVDVLFDSNDDWLCAHSDDGEKGNFIVCVTIVIQNLIFSQS